MRESGTEVVLIQPTVQDLDAMGTNLMSRKRRHDVTEVGARTVADHLRDPAIRSRLAGLPAGDPVLAGRPDDELASRLDFGTLAR